MHDEVGRADPGADLDEGLRHIEMAGEIRLGRHEVDDERPVDGEAVRPVAAGRLELADAAGERASGHDEVIGIGRDLDMAEGESGHVVERRGEGRQIGPALARGEADGGLGRHGHFARKSGSALRQYSIRAIAPRRGVH